MAAIALADDSWLDFEPAWLSADEGARCLDAVRGEVEWVAREIVIYGKRIMQPRLVGWAGDVPYRYSGQTLEPRPFTDTVRALTERVNAFAGTRFNHVLLNRYRDGRDNMGMHADDEPELGPDPIVATLSLGTTRRMTLVPRRPRDGERRSLELTSGSLLVMRGACQRRFRHGIPREPRVTDERVSAFAGTRFNHVLLNRYRDGRDNLGMHSDDEPELGPDPIVATLSLGATGRMTLVPRRPRDGERRSVELTSGSLLVMRGACQRRFRHGIPREPRVTDERVSLTFRVIV